MRNESFSHWRSGIGRVGIATTAVVLFFGLSACQAAQPSSTTKGPISVGSIDDVSGGLSSIGQPKADAAKLAIKDINSNGGVLGRQLKLVAYDAQSDNTKYIQYANQLAQQDHVAVVEAGITSAAREAIRPILDSAQIPYFYSQLYEGGVCDANVFATGMVPSQQLAPMIPYATKHYGKTFTILAADYNFGHSEAVWAAKYIKQNGGTVVKTEFLSLDQTDFGSSINNLQRDKPSVVVSLLVGGNQMSFYKQFAAAGLSGTSHIISPTFGDGQEQLAIGAKATEGIVVANLYLQERTAAANSAFLKQWYAAYGKSYPYVTPSAVAVWNSWHLWAAGVNKAGSLDRAKVLAALQSGISYDGPGGKVTINGASHHVVQNVVVAEGTAEGNFRVLEVDNQVAPAFEESKCNLIKSPTTNTQYIPSN